MPAPGTGTLLTLEGQSFTLTNWAKRSGINVATLRSRLRKGWSLGQAINTPVPEKPIAGTCTSCDVAKQPHDFYLTASGQPASVCKECTKARVKVRYGTEREKIVAYERERSQRPERRAKRIEYTAKLRKANPLKRKAWASVSYALRKGHIVRKPCEMCGNPKTQAHHHDYSKPLDVEWLCFDCHRTHGHGQTVSKKTGIDQ